MRRSDIPPLPAAARARPFWVVLALVLLVGALALSALPRLERSYLLRAGAQDQATLRLATEILRGALERTQALPALIADRPILATLLRDPDNSGVVPFTNELLRQSALSLDVSDIYVMDLNGRTVAASNYRADTSFVGQVFDYRPYFIDALNDGIGRFHALGTTSGQRGYFFAAPVISETEVLGVVAVKITLDGFEETWANSESHILVTDTNNVIFLSDRIDWHFRTLGPVPEPAIEAIAATRQYPLDRLAPLTARRSPLGDGIEQFVVQGSSGADEDYVIQTALIAAPGWRVSILTPTASALSQAWTVIAVALLMLVVLSLVLAVILQRRARLMERIARAASAQEELELRVADRTRDLDAANRALLGEVEERRATEERLRRTQAELVQAGKLAALGQMSAALSHEFNQPLAAIKAYADNAGAFLDRGRHSDAHENVTRISQMTDRMASISKHLRNFARRPLDKTGPVPLRAVVSDALELMAPRLDKAQAVLTYTPPEAEIWVKGGRVRLQQVVVNLIGNALDAMQDADTPPAIDIALTTGGPEPQTRPAIRLRDHGPGLSQEALEAAFDPFFTTKAPGQGLGLGLSISYNIVRDFNGILSAANDPQGGAVFTVTLDPAEAPGAQGDSVAAQ